MVCNGWCGQELLLLARFTPVLALCSMETVRGNRACSQVALVVYVVGALQPNGCSYVPCDSDVFPTVPARQNCFARASASPLQFCLKHLLVRSGEPTPRSFLVVSCSVLGEPDLERMSHFPTLTHPVYGVFIASLLSVGSEDTVRTHTAENPGLYREFIKVRTWTAGPF